MKKYLTNSIVLFFIIMMMSPVSAQIDGGLLLGLINATTTEMNNVSNPVQGSLLYNSTESAIYKYNGTAWEKVGSSSVNWNTSGNTGLSSATNFLGTTDAQDMVLKANNQERLLLSGGNQTVRVNQAVQFGNHPFIIRANGNDVLAFQDASGTTKWHWNILGNGLNFVETGVLDYRLFLKNGGGVGIDTNDPTEQLDVNGGARIRTLENATNTDNILTASATGVLHKSKINYGGRWTNTNTSTNLNVNNVVAPIFGNEDYKDDGNSLYEISGSTLTVKEAGRYDIRANLSLVGVNSSGSSEQRTNANARIAINGTVIGARSASGYIRYATNHTQSSIHMSEILELNASDVVSILMFREANSGTVRFSQSGESSFVINKLK